MLVLDQHGFDDTPKFIAIVGRHAVEVPVFYFQSKGQLILCFKRRSQGSHLVSQAPERPNITLFVVLLVVDLFWAHVVGCADVCLGVNGVTVKDARQAKVTQLDILAPVEEDVSWF